MAAHIQKVLRRDLRHLAGSDQDERVEDHLEKAMANYEELSQVEKDHREMMDKFLSSAKEARTLLEPGADGSPLTEATTISKVKGKITSFQKYREVLQTKSALIKKLWWRAATCKAERDVVRLNAWRRKQRMKQPSGLQRPLPRRLPCPRQFQQQGCPKQ